MSLDEETVYQKVDRSGMLAQMEATPRRLCLTSEMNMSLPTSIAQPKNVVIAGVGGSGITGDIISDYLKPESQIPVAVCRASQVPKFVNEETLFVAVSYSGETRETLALLEKAIERKAMLASITSGGMLLSKSLTNQIPHVRVTAGLPPRVALPELISSLLLVLARASLLQDLDLILKAASRSLEREIEKIKTAIPINENPAKQMAEKLRDKLPILIGPEERTSVLRRFKNELNENSKMPAFYIASPECYHDDIEGLRTLNTICSAQPIFLISRDQPPDQIRTRLKLFKLLDELDFPPVLTFEGSGENLLSELLTAITFGDYVSVYLAILRGIDPTDLTLIPNFRAATMI
jgi:glucose/mannose-6-phosphate isomerase